MTFEDQVTAVLRDRAGDVEPDADLWARIEASAGGRRRRRPDRSMVWRVAAAVVLLTGVVALVRAADRDRDRRVPVVAGPPVVTAEAVCRNVAASGSHEIELHVTWAGQVRATPNPALGVVWSAASVPMTLDEARSHVNRAGDPLALIQNTSDVASGMAAQWIAETQIASPGKLDSLGKPVDIVAPIPSNETTFVLTREPVATRTFWVAFFDSDARRATTSATTTCPDPLPAANPRPGIVHADRQCRNGDVELGPFGRAVIVTNVSTTACFLPAGDATLSFLNAAGKALPFTMQHKGPPAARADLAPSGKRSFGIVKPVCTAPAIDQAVTARVVVPGTTNSHDVTIDPLDLCPAGDAGNVVSVSPLAW
jgi:hypothetical protein